MEDLEEETLVELLQFLAVLRLVVLVELQLFLVVRHLRALVELLRLAEDHHLQVLEERFLSQLVFQQLLGEVTPS